MTPTADLSVILPAHQEEARIGACLDALGAQDLPPGARPQLLVVANGCRDATAQIARDRVGALTRAGWQVQVIETPEGNKIAAINLAETQALGPSRLFLDADVVVAPGMIRALMAALEGPGARYVGARLRIPPPRSTVSAAYARFWQKLPFVSRGVTGAGLFAVNAEGRARWGRFPQIISDDGFARLHFAPAERLRVELPYDWPITEGFARLVRVRRRQDAGNAELARLYPQLMVHAGGDRASGRQALRLGLRDPAGFAAYAAVTLAVRMRRPSGRWDRGR